MWPFKIYDNYLMKSGAEGIAHVLHLSFVPVHDLDSQHVCAGCYKQKIILQHVDMNRIPSVVFSSHQCFIDCFSTINQSIKFYLYSPYSQTTVRLIGL